MRLVYEYNRLAMLVNFPHQTDVPREYHSNFVHLFLDIAWFGVVSGSAVNFLNIYAARIGATGLQIGLIGAMSAVVNLFLAIPAGHWIERRHTGRAVFWASVFYRLGYAIWIPLPWLFNAQVQIWALIIITFLMAIPLTPLGVGFNALFAEAVPTEWRAHVAGIRNITLSITFMLTSLLSGAILDHVTFPTGYQIVFAIGFLGAAMSSLHLYFVKPLQVGSSAPPPEPEPADISSAPIPRRRLHTAVRLDIWQTRFRNVLLVLFAFHLAQYLAIPLFPLYNVRVLNLSDDHIGIGTALFYLTVLIGSTQLNSFVHRIGHKRVTGWGVAGLALYPFFLSRSHAVWHFYLVSILGGLIWAIVSGAYANYLLEHTPPDDRPPHLAWYNIILNAAVLIGSLSGPAIAGQIGLASALMLFALFRLLAGIAILRWG